MRRFIHLVIGGLCGAFLAELLFSYLGSSATNRHYFSPVGALLGAVGGAWGGRRLIVPVTGAALGAMTAGAVAYGWMVVDARARHLSLGDTNYEGAAAFIAYWAILGALVGLGVAVLRILTE